MRIYFDGVHWENPRSGPSCFALRLAQQLGFMGHTLADRDDYDVALTFIEATPLLRADRPYVQRLDGFWFSPEQFASTVNDGIRRTYEGAASVIWQSDFDRKMVTKWFGEREGRVIRNGVPLQERRCFQPGLLDLRRDHEEVFVCSANWHPQKRLEENIELFRRIRRDPATSCLVVMGENPQPFLAGGPRDRIFYTGSVDPSVCMEIYAISDMMIHLAWLDHSPNTVVEALSVGTPVICSEDGGTAELVSGHGHVLKESEPFSYELVRYDRPPALDLTQLALPLGSVPSWDLREYDIARCAQQYEAVLRKVAEK